MPIRTDVTGAVKWNQVIHVMDGEDIWAMDPESNLYDKVILRYVLYIPMMMPAAGTPCLKLADPALPATRSRHTKTTRMVSFPHLKH